MVVTVTPIINFCSTEKLFGKINSKPKATINETIIAVNSL